MLHCLPSPPGPLTSFLDSDGDLSRAPQYTAYGEGGRSPGRLSRSVESLGSNSRHQLSGGKPHKGAKFTDLELKILRYAYKECIVRAPHEFFCKLRSLTIS